MNIDKNDQLGALAGFPKGLVSRLHHWLTRSSVLSLALMMMTANAGLRAQTIITTNSTSLGITVVASTGGTLINSATIISAGTTAVEINTLPAQVDNQIGGRIETTAGAQRAVDFIVAGTIVNAGVISATAGGGYSIGVHAAGSLDGANSGLIEGTGHGVFVGGDGRVINSGTIVGTLSAGIRSIGVLTGTNSGFVQGGESGVYLGNGGVVSNRGAILGTATDSSGINARAPAFVDNSGGLIQGNLYGVYFYSAGTLANSGSITGVTDSGIGGRETLAGVNSGFIAGGQAGVWLGLGGSFDNSGTIISTGEGGYGIGSTGSFTGSNTGFIQGGNYGVYLHAGGLLMNSGTIIGASAGSHGLYSLGVITGENSGVISGGTNGVYLAAGGVFDNSGTITGTAADGNGFFSAVAFTGGNSGLISGGANGVYLAAGGLFNNTGGITGTAAGGVGLYSASAFTGSNLGLIEGGWAGMRLDAGGTVTNTGIITGTAADSHGLYSASTLVVGNSGLVQGGHAGILIGAGSGALDNTGTIAGFAGYGISSQGGFDGENTGVIAAGGLDGVRLFTGGTLANGGLVSATAANAWGVRVDGGFALVDNTGTITGGVYAGGTTVVRNDGLINGANGVRLAGSSSLIGGGSITVSGTALILGGLMRYDNSMPLAGGLVGVYLEGSGTLTNSVAIEGTAGHGVLAEASPVVVGNTGVIRGGDTGIRLAAGGVFSNSGTIAGQAGAGVYGGAVMSGTNSGLVQGGTAGVGLFAGGTVWNGGTITGIHGVEVYGAPAIIGNSGRIEGLAGGHGIYLEAGGTVTNTAGTILGMAGGVVSATSALVTNTGGGLIGGGRHGIMLEGGGTLANAAVVTGGTIGAEFAGGGLLVNSGTVTGTADAGVYAGGGLSGTNSAGGLLQGGTAGAVLAVGGEMTNGGRILGGVVGNLSFSGTLLLANSGTIAGAAGDGVRAGGAFSGSNAVGGLMSGGVNGAALAVGGTLANAGVITGGAGAGLAAGGLFTGTNAAGGLIRGGSTGVFLGAGGTLHNSGTIAGDGYAGVHAAAASTVTNAGLVQGGVIGARFAGAAALQNSGRVIGGGAGLQAAGAFAGVNSGLLQGGTAGLLLELGGTLSNSGTISGTAAGGIGLYAGGVFTGTNSGLVSGGATGVALQGGGTLANLGIISGGSTGVSGTGARISLLNTGSVSGAVRLAAAVNSATLAAGGRIDGALALAGGAADTLTLAAASGEQSHAAAVTGSTILTGTLVKTGAGAWVLDAAAANLAGLAQKATLVRGGTLAADWTAHQLNGAAASIDIAAGAALQVNKTAAAVATLSGTLTGAGCIDLVNTATAAGGRFELAASTGGAFTGTIGVRGLTQTAYFRFDNNADTALTAATLRLGERAESTLDTNRTIHGLDLAGGIFFAGSSTSAAVRPYALTVDVLAGSSGTIGVATDVLSGLDLPRPPGTGALTANLFDVDAQAIADNRTAIIALAGGTAASLTDQTAYALVDSHTNALGESGTTAFYGVTGSTVIGAAYNGYKAVYRTSAGGTAGIYLDYGLTAIASTHATIAVTLDPTGSADKTLSAKLTGTGAGFTLTGTDTVTLAQKADYTGATLITGSAVLKAGVADVIAASRRVTLAGEKTGLDLGGYGQSVQDLSGSGSIALGVGTLTVDNSGFTGTLSGAINGTGGLGLAGGEFTLTGANTFTGTIRVQGGAALTLGAGGTVGSIDRLSRVAVAAGGTLAFWRADATVIANSMDNAGVVEVRQGSGEVELAGPLTGTGTLVQNASAATTLSGASEINLLVNTGTVQIGTGGQTGNGWRTDTLARSVALSGAGAVLMLNRSGNFTVDTAIVGAGRLEVTGGGVTLLARAQAHTGATLVQSDTLRAGATNVLATSSGLRLTGAAFDLNGHNQILKALLGEEAASIVPAIQGVAALAAPAGATVFYHTVPGAEQAYATLTTGTLAGATTQHLNVDVAGRLSDKLNVTMLATGTHRFVLHRTTTTEIDDAKRTYALDMLALPANASTDPAVLDISSDAFEMGAHTYRLYRGDGGRILPDKSTWYLSGGDARSRAGDAIYWTAGVAGLDWHYSLDSLRKRMGELRQGVLPESGNVWVTANTYRLNAGGGLAGDGFTQGSLGLTAGGDKRIELSGNLMLLAGGFISFARHERDFENHGNGETSGAGLGGYATVLHKGGWYGDFVLRADRNSNKLHAEAVDGFVTDARYGSEAVGASLELGRHVILGSLWLEPAVQLALARLGGESYDTERHHVYSEPIHVRIDGATAMQARVQMRGGVELGRWQPYLRVAEVRSDTSGGALRVEGREWTPCFDGWRFEAGLGAGCWIDPQSQLYFDYEYNKAGAYERPWSLSLGYRRAW